MNEVQMIGTLVFIFGAIVGSFLNVCIVRLPDEKSVIRPRSHCIHCQKPILWYDNIPLLSYLILKGRCRFCQKRISFRYFWVEFITALTFVGFYRYFGLSVLLIPYLVMVCGFIAATVIDFKHRIIPDEVSIGGILAGMIFSFFLPRLQGLEVPPQGFPIFIHLQSVGWSVAGVLVGGGVIYAMGLLGDFLFKKESMGGGDVKFLAMIGAFLGWKLAILTFFISPFFGAVFGIIEKVRKNDSAIPYGPFLALGALISLFWGEKLIAAILGGTWLMY